MSPQAETPPRRRKFALSWSADERQFVDWLLETWNASFRGIAGGKAAYKVRGNTGAAVRFYRRLCQMQPTERFSQDDIAAAIKAYAANPANKNLRPPAWRYFHDWFDEAEDRIAAELARVGRRIGVIDQRRDAAQKVIEHLGLNRIVAQANNLGDSITYTIRAMHRDAAAREKKACTPDIIYRTRWLFELIALLTSFEAASSYDRAHLNSRARTVFAAAHAREPYAATDDNALFAISLALMNLDAKGLTKRPKEAAHA